MIIFKLAGNPCEKYVITGDLYIHYKQTQWYIPLPAGETAGMGIFLLDLEGHIFESSSSENRIPSSLKEAFPSVGERATYSELYLHLYNQALGAPLANE
jgi:hypothetical protein